MHCFCTVVCWQSKPAKPKRNMYLLISYVLLTITLLSYLFPDFFSMIYWARRINSSSVLCQTRDHLLSKTFHPPGKTLWKNSQQHQYSQRAILESVSFSPLCFSRSYSHPSRMELVTGNLKRIGRDTLHLGANSEYQMSSEECYKKSEQECRRYCSLCNIRPK